MYFVSLLDIINIFALCIIVALLLFYLLYLYNVIAHIKTHTDTILFLYGIFYVHFCIPLIIYTILYRYSIYRRHRYVHLNQIRCVKMFIHVSCCIQYIIQITNLSYHYLTLLLFYDCTQEQIYR